MPSAARRATAGKPVRESLALDRRFVSVLCDQEGLKEGWWLSGHA